LLIDGSSVLDRLDTLRERIVSLKKRSLRIALDHFGRDRIAVHLVDKIPVDTVRVSEELAPMLISTPRARELANELIDKARSRHKSIIMPNVKDSRELSYMWELQVDYVQGGLVGHPRRYPNFDFPEMLL
jgi:EAL domain-containing protein (putative c-di-GMP-specific phosphodiesterase class I)